MRTAKRVGVPDAVGMRVTGHKEQKVYDGYDRNSGGDDLRAVVETVHAARLMPQSRGRTSPSGGIGPGVLSATPPRLGGRPGWDAPVRGCLVSALTG